jgi:hypothetical protein
MHPQLLPKLQPQVKLQQVMSSMLLEVSGAELEQIISRELASNPALERMAEHPAIPGSGVRAAAAPDRRFDAHSAARQAQRERHSASQRSAQARRERGMPAQDGRTIINGKQLVAVPSTMERLAGQAALVVEGEELALALRMLHMLDDHGYLRASQAEIAGELGIEPPAVERLVEIVQELEPPGIGARMPALTVHTSGGCGSRTSYSRRHIRERSRERGKPQPGRRTLHGRTAHHPGSVGRICRPALETSGAQAQCDAGQSGCCPVVHHPESLSLSAVAV